MSEQPTTPRDPHADNDLIDTDAIEPGAQSDSSGGRVAQEIASRDEEKSATGGDSGTTRDTKGDRVQPDMAKRSDHEGAQTVSDEAD